MVPPVNQPSSQPPYNLFIIIAFNLVSVAKGQETLFHKPFAKQHSIETLLFLEEIFKVPSFP